VVSSGGQCRENQDGRNRKKRKQKKKQGRKRQEEETEKGEDGRSKEDSRRVGNLRQRRGGGKIRGKGKKVSAREISQMDKSVWKEAIGEDANKKGVGPHNRYEGRGRCIHCQGRKGRR